MVGVNRFLSVAILVVCIVGCSEPKTQSVPPTSITGQVVGKDGPEAGVWVIAETDDLPTGHTKIVVTNDQGEFLLPDLPFANYKVWVRGYGLKDSEKKSGVPGDNLRFDARYPSSPQEAAEIYPANYWYSLVEPPAVHEFPGTGYAGNGLGTRMKTQESWIDAMKQECQLCHQIGNKQTREVSHLGGKFKTTQEAWSHRLSLANGMMEAHAVSIGRNRLIEMYADWTDRISAGEVPPQPPRPEGIERNVVITMWDWGDGETSMVHDEIATDKRNPTLNANGPYYGVAQFDGELLITDPQRSVSKVLTVPMRSPDIGSADNHNPMMDDKGRIWMTSRIRKAISNPDWCQAGSNHLSAKYFPLSQSARHASYYDPKKKDFKLIDTCYSTHHLQFASDADDTLWFSGDTQVIGWINSKSLDETGDEKSSQGWCPTVLDTNSDGKITKPWNEPGNKINQQWDTRIGSAASESKGISGAEGLESLAGFAYGIIPNSVDGSIWVTRPFKTPGELVRLDPGSSPPETCKAEVYHPPFSTSTVARKDWGFAPRGIDVDTEGVIWTALSGSNHMASFDRRKCKIIDGPNATGKHCPEGWTLYPAPGPKMKGVNSAGGADFNYYNWVDQFNTLGLGNNIPIATGTSSDSLQALIPETGEWLVMRVPYPMGFYTRGLDGRIDDPEAGWKGRAVYANYGGFPLKHIEGGEGTKSKIVKFQIRSNPLEK